MRSRILARKRQHRQQGSNRRSRAVQVASGAEGRAGVAGALRQQETPQQQFEERETSSPVWSPGRLVHRLRLVAARGRERVDVIAPMSWISATNLRPHFDRRFHSRSQYYFDPRRRHFHLHCSVADNNCCIRSIIAKELFNIEL